MKELKRHKMHLLCFTSVKSVDIVSHMRNVIVSILTWHGIPGMLYACHYVLRWRNV